MPLRREVGDATEQRDGSIVFTINDGAGTVPCTVTRDALMVLLNDHDHSHRVFLWHRLAIERIAREKLAAGDIDPDGGITLAAGDVLRLFPE